MMKPKSRPQQRQEDTLRIIELSGVKDPICLVGMRGYYMDTMGVKGKNDYNLYDDAIFVVGPDCHVSFNANTDPSLHFKKAVATLCPGVYEYKKGLHGLSKKKPYPALRQFSNVKVTRNRLPGYYEDNAKERFWINIHKGGYFSTSSEGCQTIYPDQWESFITLVYRLMADHKTDKIKYILKE